jgi:hypothetical protein
MTADARQLTRGGGPGMGVGFGREEEAEPERQPGHIGAAATVGAWAVVLEVVVGAGVLLLFLVALAWDPIDRRIGARKRHLEARAAQRALGAPADAVRGGAGSGAYAILPAE